MNPPGKTSLLPVNLWKRNVTFVCIFFTWAQWREPWVKIAYYVVRIVLWTHCISLLCHAKEKKKEIHIKAQEKKTFLVVFNQQASVACCKDFMIWEWPVTSNHVSFRVSSISAASGFKFCAFSLHLFCELMLTPLSHCIPVFIRKQSDVMLIKLYCAFLSGRVQCRYWQQGSN